MTNFRGKLANTPRKCKRIPKSHIHESTKIKCSLYVRSFKVSHYTLGHHAESVRVSFYFTAIRNMTKDGIVVHVTFLGGI